MTHHDPNSDNPIYPSPLALPFPIAWGCFIGKLPTQLRHPSITFANHKHPIGVYIVYRLGALEYVKTCLEYFWNILYQNNYRTSYNHHCDCFPHFLLHFICFLLHSLYVRYSFSLFYTAFFPAKPSIFGKVLPIMFCDAS